LDLAEVHEPQLQPIAIAVHRLIGRMSVIDDIRALL
jgi:hypothetical protein